MPDPFESRYTDMQRDAMAYAYEDRRIRPAARVVALAAAGELTYNGQTLEPFDCNVNSVRHQARLLRKRRLGQQTSALADAAPRDAIETLRRRLVSAADHELQLLERAQGNARADDHEAAVKRASRLREVTRAVREAAALPGPNDPRPPAPGARRADAGGQRTERQTRDTGMAGQLIAAHRAATQAAPTHG